MCWRKFDVAGSASGGGVPDGDPGRRCLRSGDASSGEEATKWGLCGSYHGE